MKLLTCILFFMLCAGAAFAAERPESFAYGATLEADGSAALYEITLPATVYQGVTRADLGDVRVFNGAGDVVPHAWRPRRTASADATAPVALTLFPLKAEAGTRVDDLSVSVRRSAGGTVGINVASPGTRGAVSERTIGYLTDLSAIDRALRAIDFDWHLPAGGFAGKMRVDASDDLAAWRTLVTDAPLVSLEVAGQRLQHKRIELPQQKMRYLRLSWVAQGSGRPPPELTSARGELAEKNIDAPREWTAIEAARGDKTGDYSFDLRGHYPVDRMRFELPEPNTIIQIEMLARERTDQPWRPVARGIAYRLRQDGGEITSPELVVGTVTDRYWLLRVDQRGGGVGAGMPRVLAGWVPHQLVFSARGDAPFQLVYGNRDAKPAAYPIQTLIPGYREDTAARIHAATAGAQHTVAVRSAAALAPHELGGGARWQNEIDWKRWTLWGALAAGVVILGVMASRLARQIKNSNGAASGGDDEK